MSLDFSLAQDHIEVDKVLVKVFDALNSGDAELALKQLDLFWARLAVHIRAEHLVLFPAFIETGGDVTEKVIDLRNDHDFFMKELADLVKKLRQATDGAEVDLAAIASRLGIIKERLEKHNRIEEAEIYPLAASLDRKLFQQIDAQLHNLPPRFVAKDQ
jgi:iron-sulfur cluster repair protein YtfE (RIC family)